MPEENSADMKVAQQLTNTYEDIDVAVVLDKTLLNQKLDHEKALVLFRNFDDGMKILNLEHELNLDIMVQFINSHKFPMVAEFD